MRKIIYLPFIVLLTFCSGNQSEKYNLIEKDSLVHALIKLNIHDGTLRTYNSSNKSVQLSQAHYDSVFNTMGLLEKDIMYSIVYYTESKEIENIYEVVMDSLNHLKSVLEKVKADEMKKKK